MVSEVAKVEKPGCEILAQRCKTIPTPMADGGGVQVKTNDTKDERRRGGRTEGHLAKPTALKASRHGVAFVTPAAPAHPFFCVGEF